LSCRSGTLLFGGQLPAVLLEKTFFAPSKNNLCCNTLFQMGIAMSTAVQDHAKY
jgi:hypothetical protein